MLTSRKALWAVSLAFSIGLLALVFVQVDIDAARSLAREINYVWIALGLSLLLFEGLLSAARFKLLARGSVSYLACLLATAWYVLMLIGLPARLGEIAGIALIVRYMRESAGAATVSLLFQRVFDLVVLASMLAIGFALAFSGTQNRWFIVVSLCVVAALAMLLVYLEHILAQLARPLLRRRQEKWPRRLLRLLLQARAVRRHHINQTRTLLLAALTLAKWCANLLGIACVVIAVVPALPVASAFGLGIVYNLAAVIPIQTVGGFGISEAVLLASFKWLGYSLALGAPLAIAIRLALISAPIAFWLCVVGGARFFPNRDES